MAKRTASQNPSQIPDHRSWSDPGFSLLEMVVAVSVFAIMMVVVVPHLLGIGTKAQAVACEQDQRMIRGALTEYYLEYHAYPTGSTADQLQTLVNAQLLDSVPIEPSGGSFIIDDSDPSHVSVSSSVHGELGDEN